MLREEMESIMKDHKEEREQIENDAWEEIDAMRDKNKEELAKHIDAGMESKCSLTMVTNDKQLKEQEKKSEKKKIDDKQKELAALMKQTSNLK